jgi:hypothetical protein
MPYVNFSEVELRTSVGGANVAAGFSNSDWADSSGSPHLLSSSGTAARTTGAAKFGSKGLNLDGSGAYLALPSSSDWNFPGDFTVEMWVYPKGTAKQSIFGYATNEFNLYVQGGGTCDLDLSYVSAIASKSGVVQNAWNFISVSRVGSTLYLGVGGTVTSVSNSTSFSFSSPPRVGTNSHNDHFNGYIDDIRITKGVGRYTANFTPPSGAFADNSGGDSNFSSVVLLAHFEDPTNLATASSGVVANAFDNNTGTNWESSSGTSTYIACQFTSAKDIVEYVLKAGTYLSECPVQWEVQASDDGSTWATVAIERSITWSAGETKTFAIHASSTAVPAFYWRLNISATNYSSNTYCAISEFELHTSVGGAQAASGGFVSASTEQNYPGANAFDSNTSTYWETHDDVPFWLRYQFSSAANIVEYSIRSSVHTTETPKDWTLEHSGDGVNWTVADTRSGQSSWSSGEVRTFTLASAVVPRPQVFTVT